MAALSSPVTRGRTLALTSTLLALVGFLVLALGLAVDPARTWLAYLWVFVFAFTIAVGSLIFLMIGYTMNARWVAVVRRCIECVMLPLPALAVLFVPLLFGLGYLYPWHTHPAGLPEHELHVLEHRGGYLNTPAFVIRAVLYLVVVLTASLLLRRWSVRRDSSDAVIEPDAAEAALRRERRLSAGMLPAVAFAFTFAMFDWVMSLNPVWYSSIFGVYLFAGGFLTALSLITVLASRLWARTDNTVLTRHHFHALGRLVFAFTVFWAYAAFFQAMLIRIANKPEEVVFYLQRIGGGWAVFVWILIIGHFAVPFLLLLPRALKFRPRALAAVGAWLALMHLVDTYWIVMPTKVQDAPLVHWVDLGALAAVLGTCVAVAAWRQHGVATVAVRDPFLVRGAAYRSPL